jgi:NADPH:quinone reductase-like Zn-dependent oxidoreductase
MIYDMKAFYLTSFDDPPSLREDVPEPTPAAGQVLVRVRASSVNPVDNAIAAGMLRDMVEHELPVTLGRDYAGVVEQVGAGVNRCSPGDEVYGFVPHANPTVRDGSWAELIVLPEDAIARAPRGVDLEAAGAAPLAGITAMTCIDALELSAGERLLVVGATGGVGSLAVQLAARAGATVIAPALPEDEGYLRDLGVTEVIDRDGDLPGGFDAVLDVVSYTPDLIDAALEPGGRAASPNSAAGDGPGRANVMAVSTPENLERLAGLLEDGTLRIPIQARHGLDRAGDALQALAATHTQGKVSVSVP